MFREASGDWEEFLSLENQGGWADEARQHLEADRKKLSRSEESPAGLEPGDPLIFNQIRKAPVGSSGDCAAVAALAEDFVHRYGDTWLQVLLSGSNRPGYRGALETLASAVTPNLQGDPIRAAAQASAAAM